MTWTRPLLTWLTTRPARNNGLVLLCAIMCNIINLNFDTLCCTSIRIFVSRIEAMCCMVIADSVLTSQSFKSIVILVGGMLDQS